jgi:hypothetical protein
LRAEIRCCAGGDFDGCGVDDVLGAKREAGVRHYILPETG